MKLAALVTAILLSAFAFAQPTITYENHALKEGFHNPMTLCEYSEPGIAGEDLIWNFSDLVIKNKFTGHINSVLKHEDFENANTSLEEFGSRFYFNIDEESINQVGYSSKNGRSLIAYTNPFEKMKFPLSFGNFHSKNFSGIHLLDGKQIGDIIGNGTIEADAWGTLILPNNSVYENTLRVKSSKVYSTQYKSSEQQVEIITYRWYNSLHRYPLLVLTEIKTTNGKTENISHQAAYNNNAVTAVDAPPFSANSFLLYPNPATDKLFISINSQIHNKAKIAIYDISGKNVFFEKGYPLIVGDNELSLSYEISNLNPGTYILNITVDEHTESRELTISK